MDFFIRWILPALFVLGIFGFSTLIAYLITRPYDKAIKELREQNDT